MSGRRKNPHVSGRSMLHAKSGLMLHEVWKVKADGSLGNHPQFYVLFCSDQGHDHSGLNVGDLYSRGTGTTATVNNNFVEVKGNVR